MLGVGNNSKYVEDEIAKITTSYRKVTNISMFLDPAKDITKHAPSSPHSISAVSWDR